MITDIREALFQTLVAVCGLALIGGLVLGAVEVLSVTTEAGGPRSVTEATQPTYGTALVPASFGQAVAMTTRQGGAFPTYSILFQAEDGTLRLVEISGKHVDLQKVLERDL